MGTSRFRRSIEDRFTRGFPFAAVYLLFACLWLSAFWPGLSHAWWYADDYWAGEWDSSQRWGDFVLGDGRPLLGIWSYSFLLDNSADKYVANILLRFLQGGVHVLNATLVARLLWGVSRSPLTPLAVLPFLLWPFNADSVLWRAGSFYATAALISLTGLSLIRHTPERHRFLWWGGGAVLCGLSMLALQTSAFASITVWLLVVALTALEIEQMPWRRLLREGLLIACGTIVAAAISLWLIKTYQHPANYTLHRTRLANDFGRKLDFLIRLNTHVFLFPNFYSLPVKLAHVSLALVACFSFLWIGIRRHAGWERLWRPLLVISCLLSCLIFPYAAQLVVAESAVVLRTLYLGPLLFTALVAIGVSQAGGPRFTSAACLTVLAVMLISYWPISRIHAREFVECYRGDMAQLHAIEQQARKLGVNRIFISRGMQFFRYNPLHLRYSFFGTKNPIFAWPLGLAEIFVRNRSRLEPVIHPKDAMAARHCEVDADDVLAQAAAEQRVLLPPSSKPQYMKLHGHDVMGIFMP